MRFTLPVAAFAALLASTSAQAQGPDGGPLFAMRCKACHSTDAASTNGVGPNLRGLVGRKAASTKFTYSPALAKSGLVWNAATLDKFLAAPMQMVPGTRMVIGVPDAAQRKAIIGYLAKQK